MSDEPERWHDLTEFVGGDFGFAIKWRYTEHWSNVTAYEITGRNDERTGTPLYQRNGATSSPDWVETIEEAEPYLDGYIKWDGCSELNQGQPHWCGADCVKKHIALLSYLYKRAMVLMDRHEDPWEDHEQPVYAMPPEERP